MIKNKKSLYELLELETSATTQEIDHAYKRLTENIQRKQKILGVEEAQIQQKAIDMAHDVLSVKHNRDAYDAKLMIEQPSVKQEDQIDVLVDITDNRTSPLKGVLTIIAGVLVIWIVLQLIFTFIAYRNTSKFENMPNAAYQQQEKLRLQEFYQEYGVRVNSMEEADAIIAEQRAQQKEEREKNRLKRNQEREYNQWLRESQRTSDQVARARRNAEKKALRDIKRDWQQSEREEQIRERNQRRAEQAERYEANKQRRKLGLRPL